MYDQAFLAAPTVSGVGFEEFLETYRSNVPDFSAQPEGRPREAFRWRSEAITRSGVTLLASRVNGSWSSERETSQNALSLLLPLSGGGLEAQVSGKLVSAGPNEAILAPISHIRKFNICCDSNYSGVGFVFDEAVLASVLNSLGEGANLSALDLTPVIDLSSGAGVTLSMMLQSLALGLRANRQLEPPQKFLSVLAEAALMFILGLVPNRLQDRVQERPEAAVPGHVRDAIDYMHANMHKPLTMKEIAEAVGGSVRSLQQGFLQHKDMTPHHYLRRIRLEAVHAEFMQPENALTVSQAALKWGFSHPGRFAAQYEAAFGVAPADTVRNTRTR